MDIINKFKRGWWLYTSADLTLTEILNVGVNKLIYRLAWCVYAIRALVSGEKPGVILNYAKYIPKHLPPEKYKKALLAYLVNPIYKEYFLGNTKYYFSNNGAPLSMLKALNELGYVVDVIDYNNYKFKPKHKYDLFLFHQYNIFDAIRPRLNPDAVCIEFETTAYWKPMVQKIRQRIADFNQRHKLVLPEVEYNNFLWMEQQQKTVDRVSLAADGIIVMGDQLAGSFRQLGNPHIKYIKSAVYPDLKFKKPAGLDRFNLGKRKFLFFGGGGDVMRKGVDILLDVFIGTEYELYMCISLPPLFEQLFRVNRQKNIHNLGYLKLGSKKFYEIINQCDFIIQPAAAEGVPGGVLETMKYGLIPIVSQECNIPESADCGYLLPDNSVAAVKKAVEVVSEWSAEIINKKAAAAAEIINTVYTPENFMGAFKSSVQDIIIQNVKFL